MKPFFSENKWSKIRNIFSKSLSETKLITRTDFKLFWKYLPT